MENYLDVYLAGLKLPVVYNSRWNNSRVIPVAAAAVILTRIITLPALAGNASYTTTQHYTTSCAQKGSLNIF